MASPFRDGIEAPKDRLIVALDNMNWEQAGTIMHQAGSHIGMAKANSIALKRGWWHAVEECEQFGLEIMADPKINDIPETVKLSAEVVASAGAKLITVHANAGIKALEAAVLGRKMAFGLDAEECLEDLPGRGAMGGILGITILTSQEEDCVSIFGDTPEKKVIQFAHMAKEAGIDGIVCSGKELRAIKAISALNDLITVVPGITPVWAKKPGDQKRVVTPTEAIECGADFLVVGRAITQPPEGMTILEAAQRIEQEIGAAL